MSALSARAETLFRHVAVIVGDSPRAEFVNRLTAELMAADYDPVVLAHAPALTRSLREGTWNGALTLRDENTVVVQVYDTAGRRFLSVSLPREESDAVWALKAVEWLRAEPSAYVRVAEQPPVQRTWVVFVGGGARWDPVMPLAGGVQLGVGATFWEGLGVELSLRGPLFGEVQTGTSIASVRETGVAARASWTWTLSDRWLVPVGIGVGVHQLWVQGQYPADRALTAQAYALDLDASAGLRAMFGVLGVEARATAVYSPGSVALLIDGQRLGRTSSPALLFSLGGVASW